MTTQNKAAADGRDRVIRALTDDDTFRVMVATTTHMVRNALSHQSATGEAARHFADLLTGTVLIRETMSPGHRTQAVLRGSQGRGSIVVDAHPDGLTRGLIQLDDDQDDLSIGPGSMLQMMRMMARGRVHRSVVQPGPGADVSQALMTYMQESEQIVSMIAAGQHMLDDGAVAHAGGFVIQLLPGAAHEPLRQMVERLEAMKGIGELLRQHEGSAYGLLEALLEDIPFAHLDDSPVRFGCKCSLQAVVASLATLDRAEIQDMIEKDEVIDVTCDYCNTSYQVGKAQLQGLLTPS